MAVKSKVARETFDQVKTILVSQPQPERSPYFDLQQKYGLQVDFRPFIHVEPVTEKEFRKNRIRPDEFSGVILTSKNAIEHYFRMNEEMRIKVDPNMKYFCLTEAIANYLQKFILYRKRKVFVGKRSINDLSTSLNKFKSKLNFLLPCSNLGSVDVVAFLNKNEFDFKEAMMFRTVSSDLSDLADIKYDVLVFFSPLGIKSLYDNFPDFTQDKTRLAIYGNKTLKAVADKNLKTNIKAPVPEAPSMSMALEQYLKKSNGK